MRWLRSPWLPMALLGLGGLALTFQAYRLPAMELLLTAYAFCAG